MSKKSKVSVDDFAFFDEDERQPLNIIATRIQKGQNDQGKVEPKLSQTEVKLESTLESKLGQTKAKLEPKSFMRKKVEPKVEPQPKPILEPKLSQTEVKLEPNGSFESLVGLQRDALLFIYDSCINSGSKISGAITISNLAFNLESTVAATRKAVQRLEQKGYIGRYQFKDGRGGWTKYELPQGIYSELLASQTRAKVSSKLSQTKAKVSTQPEPQPEPKASYNSNNNNLNINTIELPRNLTRFGISTVNLQQLITTGKTTQEIVERSLAALSYDVSSGKTGNLANILFGVLGSGREYISQAYTQTLHDELEQELKRITEAQEAQKSLQELQLKAKYFEFVQNNPGFIEQVRAENTLLKDPTVIDNIAFAKFCEQN